MPAFSAAYCRAARMRAPGPSAALFASEVLNPCSHDGASIDLWTLRVAAGSPLLAARPVPAGRSIDAKAWSCICCSLARRNGPVGGRAEPSHPGTSLLQIGPLMAHRSKRMWRLACVLCLLTASSAFAGESRAQFQVGLTITANGKASAISPALASVLPRNAKISVPLPPERPAVFGPRDAAPSVR